MGAMADDAAPDPLLTYAQAAAILGLRLGTLYQLVHERRIPHVRLGRRLVRFDPSTLALWIDAGRVPTQADREPAQRLP